MAQFPSVFGNALAESNQNNLQQQLPQSNYTQPVQSKPISTFNHQQNTNVCQQNRNGQNNNYGVSTNGLYSNQQQQIQQPMIESYSTADPQQYSHYNYCIPGPGKQVQQSAPTPATQGYGLLPQNILDQIRSYTTNSSPIFILPYGTSHNNTAPSFPVSVLPPTCIPYPMPLPIFQPLAKETECKCSSNKLRNGLTEICENLEKDFNTVTEVQQNCESCPKCCYKQNIGDVICLKQNCPASIQLQAIVSQLLGIIGIISSTITRILLKKIPSSCVTESVEEIMQSATRNIRQLPKDQLLKESKSSQEVNGLLRLYLTSSSTLARIIPILTSAQLKSNVLKALVENLINNKIMEDQGYGAENSEPLDELLLELKNDDELRQLLCVLREKECQERVNLSFASYNSQRLIAESRLTNVQSKIGQIEKEMDRRHCNGTDQKSFKKPLDFNFYKINNYCSAYNVPVDFSHKNFKSPDPFLDIQILNPRKLLLKPHVGSPETTYTKPNYICNQVINENDENCSSFDVKKLNGNIKKDLNSLEIKTSEKKSIDSEIHTTKLLENSKEYINNENVININCKKKLEKIKIFEFQNFKFRDMNCNKENEDKEIDPSVNVEKVSSNESNITTDCDQNNIQNENQNTK